MNDSDPPEGDGQFQHNRPRNGGGLLARLRNLLRLLRRPATRGPEAAMEALIAAADLDADIRITTQERFLIGNILKVHERNAGDVMVPRVDIVALDIDQPFSEVVKYMVEHGHSRVPVYRETLDDVIGFVHVKDVLAPVADRRPARLERLLRKVLFVAPSLPILDLLVQMRQARTHIAMVVDEFGGIDGLVTIEDLIEEIVGEIEDEHDVPETPTLIERPDGTIIADARIPIAAVEEQHGISLRPEGDDDTVETLGGLVFTLAGRVPKRGEIITHPDGIEFEVLDADPRRVKRLRLRGLPPASGKGAAGKGETSKGVASA
jgi:magnesium and cobalt transporter